MDFIQNETHFTKMDLLNCVQIFKFKVEEMKARYHELKSIGLEPRLPILVKNSEAYIKSVRSHCVNSDKQEQFWSIAKRVKEKKLR